METNLDKKSLEALLHRVFSFIDPNKICINNFCLNVFIDYFLEDNKETVTKKHNLDIKDLLKIINSGRKVLRMTEVKDLKKHHKADLLNNIKLINNLIDLNKYTPVAILEKGKRGNNPKKLNVSDFKRGTAGILIVEKTYYSFDAFAECFLNAYHENDSQLANTYLAILLKTNFDKTIAFLNSNLNSKKGNDDPITSEQDFLSYLIKYFE